MGMSDQPKKRLRPWIGWAAAAMLVLYPLSIGPAWYVCVQTNGMWVLKLYKPLFWACEKGLPRTLLMKYLALWSPST
jgi:hypothetical protein